MWNRFDCVQPHSCNYCFFQIQTLNALTVYRWRRTLFCTFFLTNRTKCESRILLWEYIYFKLIFRLSMRTNPDGFSFTYLIYFVFLKNDTNLTKKTFLINIVSFYFVLLFFFYLFCGLGRLFTYHDNTWCRTKTCLSFIRTVVKCYKWSVLLCNLSSFSICL